ncbi:MAG TPA: energy transducer TonB [Bacteroidia bacterium]|nr:energy transducer TonB [Bacteroidia bacterium]
MGHKTNGSWDDVTSSGRNEVVFEGRHKDYGAYYVRQRYNFALLLGFIITTTTVVVSSSAPMLINKFFKNAAMVVTHEKDKPVIIKQYIDIPPPPKPQPVKPITKQDKPAQADDKNVEVSKDNKIHDTLKTQHDMETLNPGTTTTTTGPTTPTTNVVEVPINPVVQKPVNWAEVMPKFKGDLTDFISKNADYPAVLRDLNIEGTVYATFVVEPDGTVSGITILRGVSGADQLSKATIDVLKKMPKWDPGMQGGHPVRVQLNMPVKFQLK